MVHSSENLSHFKKGVEHRISIYHVPESVPLQDSQKHNHLDRYQGQQEAHSCRDLTLTEARSVEFPLSRTVVREFVRKNHESLQTQRKLRHLNKRYKQSTHTATHRSLTYDVITANKAPYPTKFHWLTAPAIDWTNLDVS